MLNKTKTGFTTDTIDKYFSAIEPKKPNINKDITNNAFALKINEDYSIGYRYLVSDCDSSEGFSLLEERSLPNIIKNEEWNVVNAKIINMGSRMKLFIYVNGFLKFVSKELPIFNFRELDEVYDKQEGVPYNISLGGGTQGLSDSLWLDYHKPFEYILPLEKYFAGTFVGDIKSFKFYTCGLPYDKVKNNFNYEQSLLK